MSTYLYRLSRFCFARRRWVLALWLVAAIGAIAVAQLSGGKTNDDFTIPGTESQNVSDLLKAKLPAFSGGQTQVVIAASGSVTLTDASAKAAVDASMKQLAGVPQVSTVIDPYTAKLVSSGGGQAGRIGIATVQWAGQPVDVKDSSLDRVKDAMAPARAAGLQVEYGGSVYPGWRVTPSELPEVVGIIVAFLILLVTFGAFVAAGMPILGALIGVVITLMGITAVASVLTIASASTTVALMLGLSCGIDYGLFILSRHRANLLAGLTPEESVGLAVGTAGSSVVFAALTVIIALCGLTVVGIPFLTVMGLAAACSVAVALLVAITLLPAVLGFAGTKVVKLTRIPVLRSKAQRVARATVEHPDRLFGARWSAFVVRRRVPLLVLGVVVLGVLALPAIKIQEGLPSAGTHATDTTERRAYDLVSDGFGVGFNGALIVTADGAGTPAQAAPIVTALQKLPDVAQVAVAASEHDVVLIRVIPKSGPNDGATADLVHDIRGHRTEIEGATGARILVGGTTASNIDVSAKLSSALPVFLIVVVGLAFILLTFAFRTILVPLKSIIGFLLSMAAAIGAQVAMFQWGWGQHLFGITPSETISFLPIIMLAIIFGLSSDYEVFVVSRIKEEFTKRHDARAAVQRGTALSARVVTAAALIMFFIFVAFMITKDPTIKAIGFSFAVGVFLDAFVVRLMLVPAVMAIAGARIWYHPDWFARRIPDPDIEGAALEHLFQQRLQAASPTSPSSPSVSASLASPTAEA
jgi:RND superfamily putative drug exporter